MEDGSKKIIVALIGESAVGKSTLIKSLEASSSLITPIPLITNREVRSTEEDDRICLSKREFEDMEAKKLLLPTIYKHGNKYSIERKALENALNNNKIPIFDYTYEGIATLREEFRDMVFPIYILPSSLPLLEKRLQDLGRDPDGTRFKAAKVEIEKMHALNFSPELICGGVVVNKNIEESTKEIFQKINAQL